jgi:outer membrane protein TolC
MNPVYSTLNQLTASNSFPQIQNQSIGFFPQNFYDAKVHTTVPIINSDLYFNRQIQQQQVATRNDELDTHKIELIRTIKVAYFNYLSAEKAVGIYEQSLALAQEGKRVNQRLLDNGKGLPAYLIRSDAEIENLNAKITEAKLQAENARLYFNFLLNRDAAATIDTNYDDTASMLRAAQPATSQREELRMLDHAIGIDRTVLRMNRFFWLPKVGVFFISARRLRDGPSTASRTTISWGFSSISRCSVVCGIITAYSKPVSICSSTN